MSKVDSTPISARAGPTRDCFALGEPRHYRCGIAVQDFRLYSREDRLTLTANVKSIFGTPDSAVSVAGIKRQPFRAARPLWAATASLRRCDAGSLRAHPRRFPLPQAPC